MSRGIFVTGTDTGVGKTIVAAALAHLLKLQGFSVGVMKPVTSGCREENGTLVSDDALLLARAAGIACSDNIAPYRLKEPLAPAEAAKLDGIRIDMDKIVSAFDSLSESHDFVIVEGAGGLMVPLVGGVLIADLALRLELPILVVARPGLGTINHTLLTCFAARQIGIEVAGVIINRYPDNPGLAERTAPHHIGSLCGAPILGIWQDIEADDDFELIQELALKLGNSLEAPIILRELGL